MLQSATAGDTELTRPQCRENVDGLLPGNPHAVELLQDLEDASSRPCGVVVVFVEILRVCELEKSITMHFVRSVFRDGSEEAAPGDGVDVEMLCEDLSESIVGCVWRERYGRLSEDARS